MAYCKKCGKELKKGIKFCTYCGAPSDVAIPSHENKHTGRKNLTIVLAICVIAIVGILIKSNINSEDKDQSITESNSISESVETSPKEQKSDKDISVEETKKDNNISNSDADAENVGDFEYEISHGEVTIKRYRGHDFDVIVPDTIEGYPVTAVEGFDHIVADKVQLPEGILTINREAFTLSRIKEIILPEGLKIIEDRAFYDVEELEEIVIPSTVEYVGDYAFSLNTDLEKVIFLPGKQKAVIGKYAFLECTGLNCDMVIPGNYLVIGENAFKETGSFNLKWEAATVDGEAVLGQRAFVKSAVKEVIIEMEITTLPNGTFRSCKSLEKVDYPDTVVEISPSCFSYSALEGKY